MARNDPPTAMSTRFGYPAARAAGVPWGAVQPNDSGPKYMVKVSKAEEARWKHEKALELVNQFNLPIKVALLRAGALWAAEQRKKNRHK